jgi:hypothetical protein
MKRCQNEKRAFLAELRLRRVHNRFISSSAVPRDAETNENPYGALYITFNGQIWVTFPSPRTVAFSEKSAPLRMTLMVPVLLPPEHVTISFYITSASKICRQSFGIPVHCHQCQPTQRQVLERDC